jgi:capsular exopolysaccharide synthesis family protein
VANALLATRAKDGLRLSALARLVVENLELRDAYATLLSGVQLSGRIGEGKSILVTSTQPNEGKTTVAAGLAIAAALCGETVLLIDGDLRRPSLASAAGIVDGVGLSELLDGDADSDAAVHPVELFETARDAAAVSIMGTGRRSPEFLARVNWPKARKALQSVAERFGLVLFDSPPILAVNDALLLAGVADGVLLVVDAATADREEVRRAKEQLELVGTRVIGAVLNRFNPKVHGRPDHPYRGHDLDFHR